MTERYSVSALTNLLKLAIGRGRSTLSPDDTGAIQVLQGKLSNRETPNLARMAEYGFASSPPVGTDFVAVFISGDRSNGVIIATGNQQYRLKLENPGEVALYDAWGNKVLLAQGQMTLQHSTKIVLDAPLVQATGDFEAAGNVSDATRTMADDRGKYDTHKHTGGNGGGGLTGLPTIIE